jgi:hypothetical protein
MPLRRVALPLLLPAVLSAHGAAKHEAERQEAVDAVCSFDPFETARATGAAYFLATALTDTMHAGPGTATYYPVDMSIREPLSSPPHPVYGQVVRIDTYGGTRADEVTRALERTGGEAVVVPWSDRGDCRRTLWSGTALWVEPGTEGFFVAGLRSVDAWIDGRPTFDVSRAWDEPYTVERARQAFEARGREVLTPQQYFTLFDALPLHDGDSEISMGTWRQWQAAHPELVDHYPAFGILQRVRGVDRMSEVGLAISERLVKVLEHASAMGLNDPAGYTTPMHVLVAVVSERKSMAEALLTLSGVDVETLRDHLVTSTPGDARNLDEPKHSDEVLYLLIRAQRWAVDLGDPYWGDEHVLLSLTESTNAEVRAVLESFAISTHRLVETWHQLMSRE